MRIRNPDCNPAEFNATNIAADSPIRVSRFKFSESCLKLESAVFEQDNILMAQDDVVASGFRKKKVVAAECIKNVQFTVVNVEVFAVGWGEAMVYERLHHFHVFFATSYEGADRESRAFLP